MVLVAYLLIDAILNYFFPVFGVFFKKVPKTGVTFPLFARVVASCFTYRGEVFIKIKK
jgi:hypothetical protein